MTKNKIGIVIDDDFASKHVPPYPNPAFQSFESPLRIKAILEYFDKIKMLEDERIVRIIPKEIDESVIKLAHTNYHVDSIKNLSIFGSGLLSDEVFVTEDTFYLAKKAVSGTIEAIENILTKKVNQSFAIVRPPGHHALPERASGLCIFNNIANAILYLRKEKQYDKKITIIDIDDHFGDGLVHYFYEDPDVLYFSIHEFDFLEGDLGNLNELGVEEGLGTNINFPIPAGIGDDDFLEVVDLVEPILKEYNPDLIIIAMGFDMYFADPIGNCNLTSYSYFKFAEKMLNLAEKTCEGRLTFILEGGYSLIGLPYCVHSVLRALLNEKYERPAFEFIDFSSKSKKVEILKIKSALTNILSVFWKFL